MRQNLTLVLFLSFVGVVTVVFATSPFPMSLTTNTLYQNTNSTPLSIYSITHSAQLSAYLGTSSSNMLEVAYEDGGSVTISSIVYSLSGYNMSSYVLVQPNEYYKFNFTSATFIGQYQPAQSSQLYSAGNGLSLNGNVFSVNAVTPLVANAEGISLAYTGNIFVTSQGQLDAIAGSSSSINTIYLIQAIPFIRGD